MYKYSQVYILLTKDSGCEIIPVTKAFRYNFSLNMHGSLCKLSPIYNY